MANSTKTINEKESASVIPRERLSREQKLAKALEMGYGVEQTPTGHFIYIPEDKVADTELKVFYEQDIALLTEKLRANAKVSDLAKALISASDEGSKILKVFPLGRMLTLHSDAYLERMGNYAQRSAKLFSALEKIFLDPECRDLVNSILSTFPQETVNAVIGYRTTNNLLVHAGDDHYVQPDGSIRVLEVNMGAVGGDKEEALVHEVLASTGLWKYGDLRWTDVLSLNRNLETAAYAAWAKANGIEAKALDKLNIVGVSPSDALYFGRLKMWKDLGADWGYQDQFIYDQESNALYFINSEGTRRKVDLLMIGDSWEEIKSKAIYDALANNAVAVDTPPLTHVLEDKRTLALIHSHDSRIVNKFIKYGLSLDDIEFLRSVFQPTYEMNTRYEDGHLNMADILTHPAFGLFPDLRAVGAFEESNLDINNVPSLVIKLPGFGGNGVFVVPNRDVVSKTWLESMGLYDPSKQVKVARIRVLEALGIDVNELIERLGIKTKGLGDEISKVSRQYDSYLAANANGEKFKLDIKKYMKEQAPLLVALIDLLKASSGKAPIAIQPFVNTLLTKITRENRSGDTETFAYMGRMNWIAGPDGKFIGVLAGAQSAPMGPKGIIDNRMKWPAANA